MKLFSIFLLHRRALQTGLPTSPQQWKTTVPSWLLPYSFESSEIVLWNLIWPMFQWARRVMQFYQHLLRPYYVLKPEVWVWPTHTKAEILSCQLRCAHSWGPFCHFRQMTFWQWPEYGEKIFKKGCDRCYYAGCQEGLLECYQSFELHAKIMPCAIVGNTIFKYVFISKSIFGFAWWLLYPDRMLEIFSRTLVSRIQTDMKIMMEYEL